MNHRFIYVLSFMNTIMTVSLSHFLWTKCFHYAYKIKQGSIEILNTKCIINSVLKNVPIFGFQRLDTDRSGLTKMKKSVKALYNAGKRKKKLCNALRKP